MPMNVLVVAAHPDDEVLGCGGTIARHAAEGDTIHILIIAEGATSRGEGASSADVGHLKNAAERAAGVLGAKIPRHIGMPDNRLDMIALLDVIQPIEKVVQETAPRIVYTHHGGDLNRDHRIVHQAVVTACRPLPGSPIKRVLAFEAPSSTEWSNPSIGPTFAPTHFVGIADFLDVKRAALECYAMEMRPFPHPRSFEAVIAFAQVRGSQVGLMAAEAFEVVFDVRD